MSLGVKPEDRVVIFSDTRYEWTLCDIAILGAKAVTVPIYAASTADDAAYLIEHSGAKVAIVEDGEQLEKVLQNFTKLKALEKIIVIDSAAYQGTTAHQGQVTTLAAIKISGKRDAYLLPHRFEENLSSATPDDLFTICYTSGTSGTPKGVMLTHANMMSALEDCVKVLRKQIKSEREVLATFLPLSHIIGKAESIATFTFGWKQCFITHRGQILSEMMEIRPTLFFSVPSFFEKIRSQIQAEIERSSKPKKRLFQWALERGKNYHQTKAGFNFATVRSFAEYESAKRLAFESILKKFGGRLRFTICGGAPLPKEMGEYFQIIGLKIIEGYGLTETCGPVTLNPLNHPRFGTVGRPLPDVSIHFADDGEILLKSAKVFKGYYRSPKETQEALTAQGLRTGDIGNVDSQGFLHITDRKKDLIITSSGKNIAPQKIENLAKIIQYIHHLVILGDGREYLTALVTLDRQKVIHYANECQVLFSEYSELIKNSKIKILVQNLMNEINAQLPPFEAIRKFLILPNDFTIESGELTPSMKVRRNFIMKKYADEIENLYSS